MWESECVRYVGAGGGEGYEQLLLKKSESKRKRKISRTCTRRDNEPSRDSSVSASHNQHVALRCTHRSAPTLARGVVGFSDTLHPDDPGMPRPEPLRVEWRLSFSAFNIPSFLFLYSFFFLRGSCLDHSELVASDRLGKTTHSFRRRSFPWFAWRWLRFDFGLSGKIYSPRRTSSVRTARVLVQRKNRSKERWLLWLWQHIKNTVHGSESVMHVACCTIFFGLWKLQ